MMTTNGRRNGRKQCRRLCSDAKKERPMMMMMHGSKHHRRRSSKVYQRALSAKGSWGAATALEPQQM
jgi:hypothetical protein